MRHTESNKNKKIQLWVTEDFDKRLKTVAKMEGKSVSRIIREAVAIYIENKLSDSEENKNNDLFNDPKFKNELKHIVKELLEEILQKNINYQG